MDSISGNLGYTTELEREKQKFTTELLQTGLNGV
jgi:hypothetical protein